MSKEKMKAYEDMKKFALIIKNQNKDLDQNGKEVLAFLDEKLNQKIAKLNSEYEHSKEYSPKKYKNCVEEYLDRVHESNLELDKEWAEEVLQAKKDNLCKNGGVGKCKDENCDDDWCFDARWEENKKKTLNTKLKQNLK